MDGNGEIISPENIDAGLVGAAVDYLTRLVIDAEPSAALDVSLRGAHLVGDDVGARELIEHLDGLTDDSITAACRLAGYDVAYRAGTEWYKPVKDIEPDENTVGNIRAMVERMISFLHANVAILHGFDFEGGYTETIDAGGGDLLTSDTLWDIKTSRRRPQAKDTLQVLVYWIMGMHSVHPEFQALDHLGIVNPRLGKAWSFATTGVPDDVLGLVSTRVIGYDA